MATRGRILLVDDDPSVLELTGELLAMAGFAVHAVASGPDALALIDAGETFVAVVTDQSMPEMSGEEVIVAVRRRAPGLACLLVTGYGETLETEIDVTVLRKPFRATQLAAVLQEVIAAAGYAPDNG